MDSASRMDRVLVIAADPDLRRSMSQVAAARSKQYSWEEIGKAYVATYERFA